MSYQTEAESHPGIRLEASKNVTLMKVPYQTEAEGSQETLEEPLHQHHHKEDCECCGAVVDQLYESVTILKCESESLEMTERDKDLLLGYCRRWLASVPEGEFDGPTDEPYCECWMYPWVYELEEIFGQEINDPSDVDYDICMNSVETEDVRQRHAPGIIYKLPSMSHLLELEELGYEFYWVSA